MKMERDLQDHEPRTLHGLRGAQSRAFAAKFKNQKAMERWLEKHGDDITVLQIEKSA